MKTKLLILLSLIFSLYSFGQEAYKSFIHTGVTKWLYFSLQDACGLHESAAFGDTIINEIKYKSIWSSINYWFETYDNINQQWKDKNEILYRRMFYIRQSVDSSELFFYDDAKKKEYMISDMKLKVGDEFTFPGLGSDTVERVYNQNGLKTIQFKNSRWELNNSKLIFIEGVGPNRDFTFISANYGIPHALICYSNNANLYTYGFYCGCLINKTQKVDTDKFKIIKLTNSIEISFDNIAQRNWEIFDFYGRGIQKSSIVNQQSIQIKTSYLSGGIYLLRIYNHDNNEYKLLKIII